MSLHEIKPRKIANESCIKYLKDALRQAEEGEIDGVVIVKRKPTGNFTVTFRGGFSTVEVIGYLHYAQHDIMGMNKVGDD